MCLFLKHLPPESFNALHEPSTVVLASEDRPGQRRRLGGADLGASEQNRCRSTRVFRWLCRRGVPGLESGWSLCFFLIDMFGKTDVGSCWRSFFCWVSRCEVFVFIKLLLG